MTDAMLPTPTTTHVNSDLVYEPAEDSFLLLDTLSSASEILFLSQRFSNPTNSSKAIGASPAPLVLEVGTGSGVVLAFVTAHAKTIFGRDILSLGTDVNRFACQATDRTVSQACRDACEDSKEKPIRPNAASFLAILNADLTSPIKSEVIDVLIFNPPYVPTVELPSMEFSITEQNLINSTKSTYKADSNLLALSYAGGKDGMEVTNRLLEQLPIVLSRDRGTAYLLLCRQNDPERLLQRIQQWGPNWSIALVGQSGKTGGWEKLQVFRIFRV